MSINYENIIGVYLSDKKLINNLLRNIGYVDGLLIETIAITLNRDNTPHASPLGVKRFGNSLRVRIFKPSATYENILKYPYIVFNLTDDVRLFYISTYGELSSEYLGKLLPKAKLPILKTSDMSIEGFLKSFDEKREYLDCEFEVVGVIIENVGPRYYTRCKHAVTESLIHSTRVPVYLNKDDEKLRETLSLIKHYYNLVMRICPYNPYREIVENINRNLRRYNKNK